MTEQKFMRLKDGSIIDVETGKRAVDTEVNRAFAPPKDKRPSSKRHSTFENATRRYLDDLPVPTFQSRPLAIIASYVMFGLSEADSAHILQTDVMHIENILDSEAFDQYMNAILQNVREHDTDRVRKKINAAAEDAADKIVSLSKSPDEKVALAASKDVLDRVSGGTYSPSGGDKKTGFTIRVIDEKDSPSVSVKVEVDI